MLTLRKLIGLAKRSCREAQSILMPNLYQREGVRYYADGGDRHIRHQVEGITESSAVIDFGGYRGDWAADMNSRYRCIVHVFEAVPSFASNIEKRFLHNPSIRVFPYALGDKERSVEIKVGASDSSVFLQKGRDETMEFVAVKNWFQEHVKDESIALAKINIEGGEYELLDALIESGDISKISSLHIQFHNFVPNAEARRTKLREQLARTHRETFCYEWIWEGWERLDALERTAQPSTGNANS